jgi:hypothetical protein
MSTLPTESLLEDALEGTRRLRVPGVRRRDQGHTQRRPRNRNDMNKPRVRKCEPWPIQKGRKRDAAATEWHSMLAPVMKNPRIWYIVEPYYDSTSQAASAAYDISSGRNQSVPEGRWEATSRIVEEDDRVVGAALFVKYLGA